MIWNLKGIYTSYCIPNAFIIRDSLQHASSNKYLHDRNIFQSIFTYNIFTRQSRKPNIYFIKKIQKYYNKTFTHEPFELGIAGRVTLCRIKKIRNFPALITLYSELPVRQLNYTKANLIPIDEPPFQPLRAQINLFMSDVLYRFGPNRKFRHKKILYKFFFSKQFSFETIL